MTLFLSCAMLSAGVAASAITHATETAATQAATIKASVAAPEWPEAARNLDENCKPSATLTFLGLATGMDAADLIRGGGYWTEIMARAVRSDSSVIALKPEQFGASDQSKATWAELLGRTESTRLVLYPFDKFTHSPGSFDFAIMNLLITTFIGKATSTRSRNPIRTCS
jgi:hypothetical protein